jgi:ELWxxDGT repeat protein
MRFPRSLGGVLAIGMSLVALPSPVAAANHPVRIEMVPGPNGLDPNTLWFIGNTKHGALFSADAGNSLGAELYRTDGTLAGTTLVKDIWHGEQSSTPDPIAVKLGSSLFFDANDGTHGYELWRSDGSNQNTQLVRDINPTGDGLVTPQAVMNGRLYFSADDGDTSPGHGWEMWSTGINGQDTHRVTDTVPGPGSGFASYIQSLGTKLMFIASDGVHSEQPWVSDGTKAGTHMVKVVNEEGPIISYPGGGQAIAFKGKYYFVANDGTSGDPHDHGQELWRSDGTAAGTQLFHEFVPGTGGTTIYWFRVVGDKLFFSAYDGKGQELWVTDGTVAGTHRTRDINPGSASSDPYPLGVLNGRIYFTANNGTLGAELWRSDGTKAGTVLVKDIRHGAASSSPYSAASANGALVFSAKTGAGVEVWQTKGTKATTTMVADIAPGSASSNPFGFWHYKNEVFFFATDPTHGLELWRYAP